jgi:ATP-dependent Lhr-like helicase
MDLADAAGATLVLAAVDPANPYGALLPWPATPGGAGPPPRRLAGAWVVLVAGRVVLHVSPSSRQLVTFVADDGESGRSRLMAALAALGRLPAGKGAGRRLRIERIDGRVAADSPLAERLADAGFERTVRGFALTRP